MIDKSYQIPDIEHSILETVEAVLGYWDKNQICRYANKAYSKWFGKPPEELIGKVSLKDFLGNSYDKNLIYINGALRGEKQVFVRKLKDAYGNIVFSRTTLYPDSVNGEVQGYFVYFTDITESKRFEEFILKTLEEQKLLNEEGAMMASCMSHEFRNPVASIKIQLDVLRLCLENNHNELNERMLKNVETLNSEAERLTELLDNLTMTAKIEAGTMRIKIQKLSLNELAERAIDRAQKSLRDYRKISVKNIGTVRLVMSDAFYMSSILENIISNALKYSIGAASPEIEFTYKPKVFIIRVVDFGIGIPEKEKDKMFSFFYRGSNVKELPGSGLGLVIAKKLITLLKGSIDIKSEEGKGTEVTILIPEGSIN